MQTEHQRARAMVACWRDPDIDPPPRGETLQLLTYNRQQVKGVWNDTDYAAWAPLLKVPESISKRILLHFFRNAPEMLQKMN